ncbi:MAG: Gfo/Idh/MocA family oxidoreductase [Nitrospirae bacterium]|nr:Gfo/Idh/MocA family oxidoreductase [Nitrospirota bacterium]
MIRIGIVDPDTSHPDNFIPILHKSGRARVVAVQNDYAVKDEEETREFIRKHKISYLCQTVEEMLDKVDVGFIQGANWDTHLPKARPFLKAGKPVFIDKPLAGKLSDCLEFEQWARKGATILGSSSLRYCYEVQQLLSQSIEERGYFRSVHGVVGTDEFNYGVHIVEMIQGLLGPGAKAVRYLGANRGGGELFQIFYENDILVTYQVGGEAWYPFVLTVTTSKKVVTIEPDTDKLYEALLNRVLDSLEGKDCMAPVPELTETIKVFLAARLSRQQDGKTIKLTDIPPDDPGYDGAAFVKFYAEQRIKSSKK